MRSDFFDSPSVNPLQRCALASLLLTAASLSHAAQINLDNLTQSDGFIAQGGITAEHAGATVTSAGNMNGDPNNTPDFIVSAPFSEQVYVVFDYNVNMPLNFPLTTAPNSSKGFTITDVNAGYENNEAAITALGDINGDGYDDIVIGGHTGLNFIFGGQSFPSTLSINAPNSSILRVDAANAFGPFTSVDDVRVGTQNDRAILISNKDGTNSGNSYVINVDGLNANSVIDLGSLSANSTPKGFTINRTGIAANLGDIDADGIAELALVGGINAKAGMVFNAVYQDVDIYTLINNGGFFIFGNDPITSIAGIGDIDNDNVVDFAVGIESTNPIGDRAYVVYGKGPNSTPPFGAVFNLADLSSPTNPYSANLEGFGIKCYCSVGGSLSYVVDGIDGATNLGADVDGDGLSDLILGLNDQSQSSTSDMNDTYVLYGRFSRSSFNYLPDLSNANGIWASRIEGRSKSDDGSRSVAVIHDPVNPDAIIIGARRAQYNYAGAAYVVYGKPRPW